MNPLSILDSLYKSPPPDDSLITTYEQAISSITPQSIKLPTLLDFCCTIDTYDHSELLFQLLLNYLPQYASGMANNGDSVEFSFVHSIDKEIRAKGHHQLNQALKYCQKKLKDNSRSINSPIMNTLMSACLASSGISDDLGLSYAISDIESSIGYLPIHELETYDDDFDSDPNASDAATASFLRTLSFILVFFEASILSKFLNIVTEKDSDNSYNLEKMWINYSEEMNQWALMNNIELFISLTKFFKHHQLIDAPRSLSMTGYFPVIPTDID